MKDIEENEVWNKEDEIEHLIEVFEKEEDKEVREKRFLDKNYKKTKK